MSISELKLDIISAISRLSDRATLTDIKQRVDQQASAQKQVPNPWGGTAVDIRQDVTFVDILREQGNLKPTFAAFTEDPLNGEWKVSLEELLAQAN